MALPLVLGVCEDELERDQVFLKAFSGAQVDLRLTPLDSGTASARAERVLRRQWEAALQSGLSVTAFLVHRDADERGTLGRRREILQWFRHSKLAQTRLPVVLCVPAPCLESWLCRAAGLGKVARSGRADWSCGPWKKAWERRSGSDLDDVRTMAGKARTALRGAQDFEAFLADWRRAGLP